MHKDDNFYVILLTMPIQHPYEHILSPFFAHKSNTNVRIYVGYDIHSRIGSMEPRKHKNDWYIFFCQAWIVFGSESCLWKHGSREGSTQLHRLQQRQVCLEVSVSAILVSRPGCVTEGGRNRSKQLAFILSYKFGLFVFWVCSFVFLQQSHLCCVKKKKKGQLLVLIFIV